MSLEVDIEAYVTDLVFKEMDSRKAEKDAQKEERETYTGSSSLGVGAYDPKTGKWN